MTEMITTHKMRILSKNSNRNLKRQVCPPTSAIVMTKLEVTRSSTFKIFMEITVQARIPLKSKLCP